MCCSRFVSDRFFSHSLLSGYNGGVLIVDGQEVEHKRPIIIDEFDAIENGNDLRDNLIKAGYVVVSMTATPSKEVAKLRTSLESDPDVRKSRIVSDKLRETKQDSLVTALKSSHASLGARDNLVGFISKKINSFLEKALFLVMKGLKILIYIIKS